MPRGADIVPSGEKGWAFEKKGYQQKNLENLLKVLNNKEATEALEAIGKIEKQTWSEIKETVLDLKTIVESGGLGRLVDIFTEKVKENMANQLEGALAPIKTSLTLLIDDFLTPVYDLVSAIATDQATMIDENQYGALVGALIGEAFGGDTGAFFLGLAGAYAEAGIKAASIWVYKWWTETWPKLITNIMKDIKEWWESIDMLSDWYINLIENISPDVAEFIEENRPILWDDAF